ncbi:MAG TPA: nucleotidyltransferase domain-containing protein, partial [Roseiflexaceae bacterium]|nr:nucleotidyltransferase domain-containing protein [Roseiflexaceae bacterium]
CRTYGIAIVYVFGSRAADVYDWLRSDKRLTSSLSDIDIGAKAMPGVQWNVKDKVQITQAFEELFEVPRVDFVVLDEADPFLAANIIRGERLFAANSNSADEYDLYVLRRAGDFVPLERERIAMILKV